MKNKISFLLILSKILKHNVILEIFLNIKYQDAVHVNFTRNHFKEKTNGGIKDLFKQQKKSPYDAYVLHDSV